MKFLNGYSRTAGTLLVVLTALFGGALLVQIFLSGEAAMIEPEVWTQHVAWVHIFQWLSVPLPVLAYVARRRLGVTAFYCIPLLAIGLQYVLIHRALEHGAAALAGLHAICGVLLIPHAAFALRLGRTDS